MSLIMILVAFLVIAVLGITFGVLRKNKVIAIVFSLVCGVLIILSLFLIFVLIPSM